MCKIKAQSFCLVILHTNAFEMHLFDHFRSLYVHFLSYSQARDALSAENAELLAKLAEANAKIQQLNGYIATIRQHTIGFILEQMNTLQTGNDTAV